MRWWSCLDISTINGLHLECDCMFLCGQFLPKTPSFEKARESHAVFLWGTDQCLSLKSSSQSCLVYCTNVIKVSYSTASCLARCPNKTQSDPDGPLGGFTLLLYTGTMNRDPVGHCDLSINLISLILVLDQRFIIWLCVILNYIDWSHIRWITTSLHGDRA